MRNDQDRLLGLVATFVFFLVACNTKNQLPLTENPIIQNPYLGQALPGEIPKAFAPDLVTTINWEYSGVFGPDMKSFYFLRDQGPNTDMEFVVYEYIHHTWRERLISKRMGQPFVSPDGETMHLGRRYMERTDTGWSVVKLLDSPLDTIPIMRLTASARGTYFFDELKEAGCIHYTEVVNGERQSPKLLSETIKAGSYHPFVAPDESYLIFDSKVYDGYGDSDLFISYRQKDETWGYSY